MQDLNMGAPANATEAPSIAKVWRQVKDNRPIFIVIWALILITTFIDIVFTEWLSYRLAENIGEYSDMSEIISLVVSLPTTTILSSLAWVLMTAVPAIYYATDHCPGPREIFGVLGRRPLRYLLAGFVFFVIVVIGLLFCIVPGILVMLAHPLYVHYVFTTDLDPGTCMSKAFKGMFQDFVSFFVISILCALAVFGSILLCVLPALVVFPMAELYMQNYIHHKGLVSARELA